MVRLMALTFLVLGWAFYEASGGTDFAPPEAVAAPRITYVAPAPTHVAEPTAIPIVPPQEVAESEPVLVSADPVGATEPELTGPAPIEAVVKVVAASRLNMRAGPGTQHGVVTSLPQGTSAEVLEEEGGWSRVRAGGHEGWMATNLLAEAI